jgi:hypothetical protein
VFCSAWLQCLRILSFAPLYVTPQWCPTVPSAKRRCSNKQSGANATSTTAATTTLRPPFLLVVVFSESEVMIRSIISNLPIGRVHQAAATEKHAFASSKVKLDRSVSFDHDKRSTGPSHGSLKEKRPSTCTESIAFSEIYYDCHRTGAQARIGVGGSSSDDDQAEAVFQLVIAAEDDESSMSKVSFDSLPDDPDVLDPIIPCPSFSQEVYITYTRDDSDSYSLVLLEQQWFRLAKNSGFTTALYLQGITEVLHTVRGIFQCHPEESLHLVIDQGKTVYRLDRTNYRKGITACCSNALHTFLADQLLDDV